jgi:integrase
MVYAEEWRSAQPHRPRTATRIESVLRCHIYPTLGDRPIASLRQSEVQAAVGTWTRDLAPSTVAYVHATLSSILKAAVSDRLRADNPAAGVSLPRASKQPVRPLTGADVALLLDALPEQHRAPTLLAVGCGLRAGEVFGMRLDDVDMLRRQVQVRQQRGTDERVGPPKTQASHRTVPLPSVVGDAVALHLARWPTNGLLFPVKRNSAHVAFRRAADQAGLDWVRFHDLRHTYASALIESGESVKVVQARLGHASASETLNTYAHLFPDTEHSTRAAVDEFLGGPAQDHEAQSSESTQRKATHRH